ncbi:MAG TPA: GNAT family N-acetyltransferase [Gemmatimonadales bacterium]|nr:GNAT family N-acetyltransferase [Gemmatimonadales bacterium]
MSGPPPDGSAPGASTPSDSRPDEGPKEPAPPKPAYDIRRVGEDDVHAVHMLLMICGRHMAQAHGFDNWRTPYPLERLRADAREREVYAVREGDALVATFTIADRPVHPYDPAIWAVPDAPAVYVNRLAVMPAHQGRRLGAACMRWIERRATAEGKTAVRLDALAANRRLLAFYRRLGYTVRGHRSHGGYEFTCLERVL